MRVFQTKGLRKERAMSGLRWMSGLVLGASLLAAGAAYAECRPVDDCAEGLCRTIVVCANAERVQKTAAAAEAVNAAPRVTPQVARAVPVAAIAPRRAAPTTLAAALPAAAPSRSVTHTREELRRDLLSGPRRR
jgi:hypothetical protein